LAYKGKSKIIHRTSFQRSFADFWNNWVFRIGRQLSDDTSSKCLETVQTWLTVISSSSVRQFRHVATFVALQIISTLCSLCTETQKSISGSRRQSFKRQESMSKEDRQEYLRNLLSGLFDGFVCRRYISSSSIFMHRYRDKDAMIRAECISGLGIWVKNYPECYLKSDYLRYLGWMLFDKVHF
jgi:cohesin complex subunit SA-1/2